MDLWDLWEAWSGDDFLTSQERRDLDDVEPFDEWEELMLFGRHYLVLHATATASRDQHPVPRKSLSWDSFPKLDVSVKPQTPSKPLKRRFGNVMTTSNVEGQTYGIHLLGLGADARSVTYDTFALSHTNSPSYQVPLSGPLPRMCSTAVDLGDYGVLLVGGRASPAKAMSDCWLFKKTAPAAWCKTWDLPKPLYRHSALRLPNSSLALLVGGKTGPSEVSSDAFVFHPEKGWLDCEISGVVQPRVFGAVFCNASSLGQDRGCFEGMLSGGMEQDGTLNRKIYWWRLEMTDARPQLTFSVLNVDAPTQSLLSVFGATVVHLGPSVALCGGAGDEESVQGQHITVLSAASGRVAILGTGFPTHNVANEWPFVIGSSVLASGRQLTVFGGGAVCFSMGSYWETRPWQIDFSGAPGTYWDLGPSHEVCEYLESPKILGKTQMTDHVVTDSGGKPSIIPIPRIRISSDEHFRTVLQEGKPVVIEGLDTGGCLQKWTPAYMVEQVGEDKQVSAINHRAIVGTRTDPHHQVVVHECREDSEKMDFNSKNFQYVTDTFENIMGRIKAGGRLYLRSLSQDKPAESPANIDDDYPGLAKDFVLPDEVGFVRENLFSSVLRISGKVNMWLHYDVSRPYLTEERQSDPERVLELTVG